MKQRVIVIGNSYATRLGVIRSLGLIDCNVTVIHIGNFHNKRPEKPIDCYSKYVSRVLFFERQEGEEGFVRFLLEQCVVDGQKAIIIPTSDFSALAIDNDALREHFLVPYINNEKSAIGYWMNKACQKGLALHVGLNTPRSVVVERTEKGYAIPDKIKYPCFTKPVSSIGAGKRCLQRCNNVGELQQVLDVADKNDIPEVLIEDYIDIEDEFAVLGFSDGKEVVIPGVIHFLRESQTHKGIAMTGKVLKTEGFEDLINKFKRFILQLGFVGIFDIDFLKSRDVFYFDELNLRIGGSATAISSSGVNLSALFVKTMVGDNTDNIPRLVNHDSTFLNERMALDDFQTGNISMSEFRRLNRSAEILFIREDKDPGPQIEFNREFRKEIFNCKRLVKRILHIIK